VHVIRPAAVTAFFVDPNEFLENVASERSVIIGVEDAMFIHDVLADFSEGVPLVLKGVLSVFEVFLKPWPSHFWIAFESRLKIRNLFERDVFFFKIVKNVTMMFSIKTEKHLRVVQVT
jgi:hypothetical protein